MSKTFLKVVGALNQIVHSKIDEVFVENNVNNEHDQALAHEMPIPAALGYQLHQTAYSYTACR